ncbi:guanine deaminase-like [Mercenaria mercenaria]|uniref:guanine deaminase-like n=1 Tax=Mercenaria mercenaria TaxID=6596 RepID=UPI00234F4E2F|nr:guanine deaminase-like [Mercenaria mercenaria]XP_053403347.1 guanine deaminase-like [Mercenaria mercenaria]
MEEECFAICGSFIHSTDQAAVETLKNKCLGVKHGKIVFLDDTELVQDRLSEFGIPEENVLKLKEKQFVIPGFIDTHIHAPQYPNAGKGLDMGLLEWLEKYTFPTEMKFKDLKYASSTYRRVVSRVLKNGTTTACYFATIDTDATLLLCGIINDLGQRALVGKVNMNQNSPEYYMEHSVEESILETRRYIETINKRDYKYITAVVTPRFAISCCEELMKRLGQLAAEFNIPVQTHICESRAEVEFVSSLYPDCTSYADVYDKAGLLTDKTVLAHCIYLTEDEIELIKERGSAVSHCPNSNLSIRSGLLDVQKLLQQGVQVGLGTDVSGGYHPSILDAIRVAVHVSNSHAIIAANGYKSLSVRDAFRLATLEGAKALSLDTVVGNFEVGKEFDALLIDLDSPDSHVDVFDEDTLEDCLDKFLYTGDDRNIRAVYVGGRKVLDAENTYTQRNSLNNGLNGH